MILDFRRGCFMYANSMGSTALYASSETYATAFAEALRRLNAQTSPEPSLLGMGGYSADLAACMRDSSESLRDVRRICRQAVIDATRTYLAAQIAKVTAALDRLRHNGMVAEAEAPKLDAAICAVLNAHVDLATAPFEVTYRRLSTAQRIMTSLSGAALIASATSEACAPSLETSGIDHLAHPMAMD
jgi:hypothetical protein